MVADGDVQSFKAGLRGTLIGPHDEGYDAARKVWNGMIDKRPSFIVRCAGVSDVVSAINFARANDLPVAVRGGGHNVAGNAVCDDGLVVDLSLMKGIRVDPPRRTVRAEGGVTLSEFDHENEAFGFATTGGVVSTTGIAGLTLGGGIGYLARKYGLTCDNLLSVDLVTAKGELVTASATENSDLFWGVRGGGGNFGVVTSFEYKVHPIGEVLAGFLIYPVEDARRVFKFFREFNLTVPDDVALIPALGTSPDGKPVTIIVVFYSGSIKEGERILEPLRAFGPPLADLIAPMPYTKVQSMTDSSYPPGVFDYWKSSFLAGLSDECIETMVKHFALRPNPMCLVAIESLGGVISHIGSEATAFGHRDAPYNMLIIGMTDKPAEVESCVKWARDLWDAIQPFSSGGVYVNYLGREADEGIERVMAAAYGPEKYARLVGLKNKYDPRNMFRFNQNIKPSVRPVT